MGKQDIYNIHPIYRACIDFTKLSELPFTFKVDSGNYETGIVFNIETKSYRRHNSFETWQDITYPEVMTCPDVLDFDHKIIVEFEEETGPRKPGAKYAKKGHGHEGDYNTTRDNLRNDAYLAAGFVVFRLWESTFKNKNWKLQLFEFLISCSKRPIRITQ